MTNRSKLSAENIRDKKKKKKKKQIHPALTLHLYKREWAMVKIRYQNPGRFCGNLKIQVISLHVMI